MGAEDEALETEFGSRPVRQFPDGFIGLGCPAGQALEDVLHPVEDVQRHVHACSGRPLFEPCGVIEQSFVATDLYVHRRKTGEVCVERVRQWVSRRPTTQEAFRRLDQV